MPALTAASVNQQAETLVALPSAPPGPEPSPAGGPEDWPVIPGYRILEELGRGSMGVVYRALDRTLNRPVALKIVLHRKYTTPEELLRFLGEAEMQARLRHPHIVPIYELGHHDGRPYFTMELLEGGTLARECGGTGLPARRAAALMEAVARAVQHAHDQKILHRDLKPANVLLTSDGCPKLTDFGLAKQLEAGPDLTEPGLVMGTPTYMAPEQALGATGAVGPAADVYALGAMLYELLTGRPPFQTDTVLGTLRQVTSEEPAPPSRLRPGVPRDLEAVCLRCLRKDPGERYGSAGAVADELARFLAGEPIRTRPAPAWRRLVRWLRRRPAAASWCANAVAGLAAVALLGGSARLLPGALILVLMATLNLVSCRPGVAGTEAGRETVVNVDCKTQA